mmetsp:Transcript_2689/g.3605  ORF Transcript_2689/g.3605 Transcript_2689/m.3605 type:complete len:214 (-) Transcript_2689:398-1039(-)
MAKPMPMFPRPPFPKIAVFTPIKRPDESIRGPPEFPGLIAASVWMQFLITRPPNPSTSLPNADTTPVVTVLSKPNGFPIAKADWPTCKSLEVPTFKGVGNMLVGHFILSTAKSFSGSTPTTLASQASAIPCNLTLTVVGMVPVAKITWQFVTTCPCESHKIPDPVPKGTSAPKENPRARGPVPPARSMDVVMKATLGEVRFTVCTNRLSSAVM